MYLIVSVAVAALAAWLAFDLAKRKGRNPIAWAVASAILIVPVMVLAVLPSKKGHDRLPPDTDGSEA